MLRFRTRRFSGRCSKHKRYNPVSDGLGAIKGGCPRCQLLAEIWEAQRRLTTLIHRFDGTEAPVEPVAPAADPRQLSLLDPV